MTSSDKKRVGVIGASGYIGAELLRYLVTHPRVTIEWVTANSHIGKPVRDVLPNLWGALDLDFVSIEEATSGKPVDAAFVCLPHNASQDVIPKLARQWTDTVFVDLGGDFRSHDVDRYATYYKREHSAPDLLSEFVYGLTEFRREELRKTRLVANPGCFATAMGLSLAPLARTGQLPDNVFVSAITGSSGAGNKPLATTHHPERATNVRAYKPLVHQHLLEVETFVSDLGSPCSLHFVPQGGPFVRGIFANVFLPGVGAETIRASLEKAYADEPLVSVIDGSPEVRWVQGSPRAFLGVAGDDKQGVDHDGD